jgi:hypothetical protein
MISSYRLGDLVLLNNLNDAETKLILTEHPNSIASKYILEKRKNGANNNIEVITNIVMEHIDEHVDLLPKNITDSTLIHLRLGDVIAGTEFHEIAKRPLDINYLKSVVANDTNPKYVIGKCFFAETSSRNYEECIRLSDEYLHQVINELHAEHFDSGNADIDLYCAVKSKLFIQGKGFFSKLIVEIRKKLHLQNIETSIHV